MRVLCTRNLAHLITACAAALALAGPAAAAPEPAAPPTTVVLPGGAVQQDGVEPAAGDTVGAGDVITDGADQTEPDAVDEQPVPADDPAEPAQPKRGEVHVLDTARSSSPAPEQPAAAPAADLQPRAAAPAAAPTRTAAASPATLPFTGVNAGLVALMGLAMLAAGATLARLSAATR